MFTTDRRTHPTGYATLTDASSEWGPARHDPSRPPLERGTALRDADDALPDDN